MNPRTTELREILLQSAKALKQPSEASASEYEAQRDSLAEAVSESLGRRPDLERLIGAGNLEMMKNNHRNHASFMVSVFGLYQPAVLIDTVLWVFRAYRSHGFRLTYWPAQLDTWLQVMAGRLSAETLKEIEPFYRYMQIHQPAFAELSDAELEKPIAGKAGGSP
ncbi:MAG: hypothetical protein HQL31_06980 [Planctomycetes bacterium]|nr:hypothetical protein [Planctomycetota bacterium]